MFRRVLTVLAFALLVIQSRPAFPDTTLKQGDTSHHIILFAQDPTTGLPLAGLTITYVTVKAGGVSFVVGTGTITETSSVSAAGMYSLALSSSDVDTVGDAAIYAASGSAIINIPILHINAYDPFDGALLGLTGFPAAVQTGLTNQGYTTTRAPKIDFLDASISSRYAAASGTSDFAAIPGNVWGYATSSWTIAGSAGAFFASHLNFNRMVSQIFIANQTVYNYRVGDTSPAITYTLQNSDGSIPNLTGCTIKFVMKQAGVVLPKINASASIVGDATNARVMYTLVTGDMDTLATYTAVWQVTDPFGGIVNYPQGSSITVRVSAAP